MTDAPEVTYEKVDATTFVEKTAVVNEATFTKDKLLADKQFFLDRIAEIDAKLAKAEELGVQTTAEVAVQTRMPIDEVVQVTP